MFLPKSRDIQVKMPSPKVIFMHFDIVTGRSVTSNDTDAGAAKKKFHKGISQENYAVPQDHEPEEETENYEKVHRNE